MMFVKINNKWLINLARVEYLGISNDASNKIEVRYENGHSVTFTCNDEEVAYTTVEKILELFEPAPLK